MIEPLKTFLHIALRIPRPKPSSAQVDVTTVCNFKCKMCPIHFVEQERSHIDMSVFRAIIDSLDGVNEVSLVGLGEPFCHPLLTEAIRYCKDRGMVVKTTTNGVLMNTDEKMHALIDSGLDSLSVSIDALRPPAEEADGHPVGAAIRNVERLTALKRERGATTPRIIIQSVLQKGREDDMLDIIRWADSIKAHRVNVLRMHMYFDTGIERPDRAEEKAFFKRVDALRREISIRVDSLQDRFFPGYKGFLYKHFKSLLRLDGFCVRLLDYPYINQQGDLIPCCSLPKHRFGNILETSLDDVWRGEKLRRFRRTHNKVALCAKCDNWRIRQRL